MRVVRMALPDGEQQVMCQRLTVASLAALGQLDALGSEAGASVGWLGAAYSVAIRLVTAGRVLPQLTDTGLGMVGGPMAAVACRPRRAGRRARREPTTGGRRGQSGVHRARS